MRSPHRMNAAWIWTQTTLHENTVQQSVSLVLCRFSVIQVDQGAWKKNKWTSLSFLKTFYLSSEKLLKNKKPKEVQSPSFLALFCSKCTVKSACNFSGICSIYTEVKYSFIIILKTVLIWSTLHEGRHSLLLCSRPRWSGIHSKLLLLVIIIDLITVSASF